MPRLTVPLLPEHEAFVERLVASGRYDSPSDVVFQALCLLEDRERALDLRRQELKAKIEEGLEDVRAGRVYDSEDVFKELDEIIAKAEIRRDAAE